MEEINSTKIAGADWQDGKLTVHFRTGGVYEYDNVPAEVFNGLRFAPSAGQYHHQIIKGNYRYRRIG